MSFYVAAVDNLLRTELDEPTVGMILCKSRDKTTVEYALQGNQQPIGVSTYQLPEVLQENLPTVEELEREMAVATEELEENLDDETMTGA